jgi:hypothetical protein
MKRKKPQIFIGDSFLKKITESNNMIEIDEHRVRLVSSHHFNLRFVIEFIPLSRSETDDSTQTDTIIKLIIQLNQFIIMQMKNEMKMKKTKKNREPFEKI